MIKMTLFTLLFTLVYLLINEDVFAGGLFQITNRTGVCTVVCDALEDDINSNLPDADASNYLKAMGNSNVTAQKGLGVDYASNFDFFVVGYGLGAAADLGGSSLSDAIDGDIKSEKVEGVGTSAAVMAGLNMKWIGMENINVFAHFMSTSIPNVVNDVKGNTTAIGFHVQYKYIPNMGFFPAKWGGVDLTTGFEFGKMKLEISKTLNKSITKSGQTATFDGTATVGANVKTWSIPIEISTNVQLLYIVTIYGGLGLDISGGKSKAIAAISGPITVTGGGTGDASLDLGQADNPTTFQLRNFIGFQANLSLFKIFVQMNNSMTNDTVGLVLGARVAF